MAMDCVSIHILLIPESLLVLWEQIVFLWNNWSYDVAEIVFTIDRFQYIKSQHGSEA